MLDNEGASIRFEARSGLGATIGYRLIGLEGGVQFWWKGLHWRNVLLG